MRTSQFRRGSITDKILSVFFAVVLTTSLIPSVSYAVDGQSGVSGIEQGEVANEDAAVDVAATQNNDKEVQGAETNAAASTELDDLQSDATDIQNNSGAGSAQDVPEESEAQVSVQDDAAVNSENASRNVVANLASYYDVMESSVYLNKAFGTADTGCDSQRSGANAVATADEAAHAITVKVPLDPDFYDYLTLDQLGSCEGVEVSRSGDELTYVLKALPEGWQPGDELTYRFAGASTTFYGAYSSDDLSLAIDFSGSGIDPEQVLKADEPANPSVGISLGTYAATANLYAFDENNSPVYLGIAGPSTTFSEINAPTTDKNGFVSNGARLMAKYDGTKSLDIWLDESYEYASMGEADGITATLSAKDSSAGFRVTFDFQQSKGEYHFTNANISKDGKIYTDVYMSTDAGSLQVLNPSNIAPASGVNSLAPGEYWVTANLFVPGEYNPVLIGYNAFMTSSDFPPTSPVSNNAKLTVSEDGKATLDLPILCTAFTLQKVSGGMGATVKDCEWGTNSDLMGLIPSGKYLTNISFTLDDLSAGSYVFSDCEEYPVPFAQTWNLPMYLSVDLAHAITEDHKEKAIELFNEDGSMKLELTTTSVKLAEEAKHAQFKADRINSGADLAAAQRDIASSMTNPGSEEVALYSISLQNEDGSDFDLSQYDSAYYILVNAKTSFPTAFKDSNVKFAFYTQRDDGFERDDVIFTTLYNPPTDGQEAYWSVKWEADHAGSIAIADIGGRDTTIKTTFDICDDQSGVSLTCDVNDFSSHVNSYQRNSRTLRVESFNEGGKQSQALDAINALSQTATQGNSKATAYSVMLRDADVEQPFMQYMFTDTGWDFGNSHRDDDPTFSRCSDEKFTFNFPVQSSRADIYIIHVDDDGNVTAQKASDNPLVESVTVQNGMASVTWRGSTNKEEWLALNAAMLSFNYDVMGVPKQSAATSAYNWTYGGEGYSYYAVVENEDAAKTVAAPVATNDIYSGVEQTGVAEGEGYTLSGMTCATDAGSYKAIASLRDGYVWSDGTVGDKIIEWSIAPAELTATYAGEVVTVGSAPSGAVSVAGFVNGETELTAKGYVAPTVVYPAELSEGEYTLVPEGGKAANYEFTYVSGVLKVNKKTSDPERLQPGTYTITSNLFVPGELNAQLPGVTAYLTNPNNPLSQKPDGYTGPFEATAPTTPVSNNAQLFVGEDGSMVLTVPILNPVFTLQGIGDCQNASVTNAKRDSKTYSDVSGNAVRQGRITELVVALNDKSGEYVFNACKEFPTLLGVDWLVPLSLTVDFSGIPGYTPNRPSDTVNYAKLSAAIANAQNAVKNARVSVDGGDVDALDTWVTQGAVDTLSKAIEEAQKALTSSSQDEVDRAAATLNTATMALNRSAKNGTKVSDNANNGGNNGGNAGNDDWVAITESGHYAAGTYTVSGNIWFDKSVTGLPLNPHLSNGAFPPKDPVSSNATMTVDASGHAWVTIPVVIQDEVMVVNNVWGSGVSFNGSSVTIDLGTPSAGRSSFSGTCTANITMGALASTISGKSGSYTWAANWSINLGTASMASGGGTLPASALAVLAGVEGTVDEQSAEEAALEALDSDSPATSSEKSSAKASGKKALSTAGNGVEADAGESSSLPSNIGVVVGAIAAVAIVFGLVALARRKKNSQE